MEGHVFPDQEQLIQFLKRLKEVFDVCDEDADGFIRVEHLVDLGLQFGQGDKVKKLIRYLDPNTHRKINFKDFCHGVFAIKGCEEILKTPVGPHTITSNQPSVTDNGYIYQNDEAELGPPIIMCTRSYPECSMYGDGCGADGECDMDSITENANSSDSLDPTRQDSHLIGSASASVISGEEQFEDYGEGEDVDFTPSSPIPEDDVRTNGFSDLGSSLPSSAGQTPQKIRQLYNSELLDIYCSQCCKKVNLLNDLEARLRNLKANSPNRKISSTAFGRQLFQANHSVFGSSQGSSTEDLFTDSIDSCDLDITEKVSYLEKKVTELESDSLANGDLKSKLKQENTQLVHRVHELEEQVKDAETRADQSLEEETKRHREAYSKMDRDRNTEIDLLCNRVQLLEEENGKMKLNVCRLKSQTEKLDQEKQRMTDKLEDTSLRLKDEMDLYRKIMDKLWHNRHDFQKEKEAMQELIDDLRRELEYLQLFKMEMEHPGQGKGLSEYNARTREIEMEHEVKRLKQVTLGNDLAGDRVWPDAPLMVDTPTSQVEGFESPKNPPVVLPTCAVTRAMRHAKAAPQMDQSFSLYGDASKVGAGAVLMRMNEKSVDCAENHKLRDQNDDLNAQILSLSLYEAKNLFACHTKAQCLAAEIDNASRDELVDALKEQEEINLRLRQYMDKIILAILDHNPSILEIKS